MYSTRRAENGNDGIYDSEKNVANSAREIAPYWMVNLGIPYRVYALKFFNRVFHPPTRTEMGKDYLT